MSDELRNIFQIPKDLRDRLQEGTKDAQAFLDNQDLLKQLGLLSEKDIGDMKTLVEMSTRISKITSAVIEEKPPTE